MSSEIFDIPHEESILLNFFGGKVYFYFENEEEVKDFFQYIKDYGDRYNGQEYFASKVKYVGCMYSSLLNRYIIEWDTNDGFFKKRDMRKVSYSVVRDHCNMYRKLKDKLEKFKSMSNEEILYKLRSDKTDVYERFVLSVFAIMNLCK